MGTCLSHHRVELCDEGDQLLCHPKLQRHSSKEKEMAGGKFN